MVYAPALQHDSDSSTWAYFKSFEWGFEKFNLGEETTKKTTKQVNQDKKSAKDIIERLSGIVDTEDVRFEKVKEESYNQWETNVEQICEGMNNAVDAYYERQNSVFEQIQQACIDRREANVPEIDENEINDELENMANSPWLFQNLPGIGSIKSAEALKSLNNRLSELPTLAFWNEPIEHQNGGPEFFSRLKQLLLTKYQTNDDETIELLAQGMLALFATATLSGNQDLVLIALDILTQFSTINQELATLSFTKIEPQLSEYLKQIQKLSDGAPYQHALLRNNISRIFGIASFYPTSGLTEKNTSLTSDGSYLYLAIGMVKRACLFKIGTGENETIPGKVYVQNALDREGDLTWVFCQGKLYLRYQNTEPGNLFIYDPITLTKSGEAKLFLTDLTRVQQYESLNRNYPLLVDPIDGTLCIVWAEIEKRNRNIQPEHMEEYQKLVSVKAEYLKQQPPPTESEEEFKKLSKAEQQKRLKESKNRKKGDPGAPPSEEKLAEPQDYQVYSVLAFKLHKFDVTGKYKVTQVETVGVDTQSDHELLKDPLVLEMYQTFSGFFKVSDCARALKYCKQDIELAADWIVAEKEKPDAVVFKRISTTLLCESHLVNSKEPEKLDFMVRPGSLLDHKAINTGKWTINENQISYHMNTDPNQTSVLIFSTDQSIHSNQIVTVTPTAESYLKQFDLGFGLPPSLPPKYFLIKNKWILLTAKQLNTKYEDSKQNNTDFGQILNEESLYEAVKLQSSYIKTIQKTKPIDLSHMSYVTYCGLSKRFYALNLGSQQRTISSAPDLGAVRNKAAFSIQKCEDLKKFIEQALKLLLHVNKFRHNLPWRWNNWHFFYQQVINQIQKPQLIGSHIFGTTDQVWSNQQQENEKSKTVLKRLRKRLNSTKEEFVKQSLKDIGIQNTLSNEQILQFKLKQDKKQKQSKANPQQKVIQEDQLAKNVPIKILQQNQTVNAQIKGYTNSAIQQFKFTQEDIFLPTEQICIPVELYKQFAFCITGSVNSLDTLLELYSNEKNVEQQILLLEIILQWTTHATWLAALKEVQIAKLYQLCLQTLSEQKDEQKYDTKQAIIKRILIVGWQYFATDAFKQVEILKSLLSKSEIDQGGNTESQKISGIELLLNSSHPVSAAKLLKTRFCQHASFYDLEILNQRVIHNHFFVIKGIPQIQTTQDLNSEPMKQTDFQSLAKAKFFRIDLPQRLFNGIQQSDSSLADIPTEFIDLKRVGVKSNQNDYSLNFSQSNQSYQNSINPSYFNVPIACCFSKELINGQFQIKNLDIEYLTQFYTNEPSVGTTQEAKFEHFEKVRASFINQQANLMQICKSRIQSGCQSTTQVFCHFVGQAMDWIDFSVPSLINLLSEVIDIACINPHPSLLTQILIALNRSFETSSGAALVAHTCIAKLLNLIATLNKTSNAKIEETSAEGIDDSHDKNFETQHPYSKTDQRMTKVVKVSGAIGYIIEFDRRCSVESSNDVLIIKSCDYNYVLTNNVGTEFRFDRAPQLGQTFIAIGKQLEIEFRSYNPRARQNQGRRGGRGGYGEVFQQPREEYQKRWGYKINIKPIFGNPKFSDGSQVDFSILNNLVQVTTKLSKELADASFLKNEECNKSKIIPETQQAIDKILNWHLFKGGLKINEIEYQTDIEQIMQHGFQVMKNLQEESFEASILNLKDSQENLPIISNDISKVVNNPTDQNSKKEKLDDKQLQQRFTIDTRVWSPEAKQLIETDVLKEVVKRMRIQLPYPNQISFLLKKPSFKKHWDKWLQVESLLIVSMLYHSGSIADAQKYSELNLDQLKAGINQPIEQDETSYLIEEFSMIGHHINIVLNWMLARLQGQNNFQILLDETLSLAQKIIAERLDIKSKHEARLELEKKESQQMQVAEQETRDYLTSLNNSQQTGVPAKQLQKPQGPPQQNVAKAQVTKLKSKMPNKKRSNIVKLTDNILKQAKKNNQKQLNQPKEESKTEEEPNNQNEIIIQEPEQPKFVDLSQQEIQDLKSNILTQTYQNFVDNYQIEGDLSKIINLCMFFDLNLNANDLQETLNALFKRVKLRISPILDLDTDKETAIPCVVDIKQLNLGSEAEEVALDVINRLHLLLEIRPSYNYLSEVTKISQKKPKMSTIAEQEEDIVSQLSGQLGGRPQQSQVSQPDSDFDDEMLSDLPPLQTSRSMSLPTQIQSGIAKLAATQQPTTRVRSRKQSAEYAMFIDSYRKWRLWSKRSQDQDEDLLSPNGSPLHGVVSFAKMSKLDDVSTIREKMKEHVYRAAFRLTGLQYQERIFTLLQDSPFVRYIWGTKGTSLHQSVLSGIETCGEFITRQLNAVSRQLVQQLMSSFVQQIRSLANRQIQLRPPRSSGKKHSSTTAIDQTIGSPTSATINQQPMCIVDCKRLLLTLNDIRVLLSNIYTKEYVLESLRVDKHISTRNTLGVDQIKMFLRALVSILVKAQNSQGLFIQISQVAKLVLRLFIRQSEIMKSETQRILQEMLLDTVVSQLESAKGDEKIQISPAQSQIVPITTSQNNTNRSFSSSHQNSISAILKMLSEVLRITSARPDNESFLWASNAKIMGCLKLLTSLVTNGTETPAVVRQAIKCAKLLNKQIGQGGQLDTTFTQDVMKAIGDKIRSFNSEEKLSQPVPTEIETVDEKVQTEDDLKQSEKEPGYCVLLHLNVPTEEDFTFLITALYHWELKQPIYSHKLHKSVSEIIQTKQATQGIVKKPAAQNKNPSPVPNDSLPPIVQSQPLSAVQLEEVLVADILSIPQQDLPSQEPVPQVVAAPVAVEEIKEDQKDEDKDWQTDSAHSDDEKVLSMMAEQMKLERPSEELLPNLINDQIYDEQKRIVQQMTNMMEQLSSDLESEDRHRERELVYLQQKHQELERMLKGHDVSGNEGQDQLLKIQAHLSAADQRGFPPGFKPVKAPQKPSSKADPKIVPPAAIKIQYIMNAMEEVRKNWQPPLSTDSKEVQENKLKERNYQIQLSLILNEAVNIASHLYMRNSVPISRTLTLEQALEFGQLLKNGYSGNLEPVKLNPYTSEQDAAKNLSSVRMALKDLFPINYQKIKELGKPDKAQHQLQQLLTQISVAPKRFNFSIIQKSQASSLEKEMSTKLSEIKACQKAQRMGPLVYSRSRKAKLGHSISNIISELVQFIRSLPYSSLEKTLNNCLKAYLENNANLDLLYGIVASIGGWNGQISTGSPVEINTNEQWYKGVVVDAGLGKRHMIVILNDDSLTLHKVLHQNVRPYIEALNFKPDETLLLQSVVKAKDDKFLQCLLLRACANIKLSMDKSNPVFQEFLKILVSVSRSGDVFDEDKSKSQWERQLMLSWERIIDCEQHKNQTFIVGREIPSNTNNNKVQEVPQNKGIQNNDYVQPLNSYLSGLPEVQTQSNKQESRLKLLHYWEKNIIPSCFAFCQGTYRQWEFEFAFEQLRHYLRLGDTATAINAAMTMLENKLPNGLVIPDENHDWSSKILEECIVGNWFLCRIKSRSSSESSTSSTFNLVLLKLQALGIEEILVQLKSVDARNQAVLAEYTDYDTMQCHLIWIPVTNLSSLQTSLPCQTVATSNQLLEQFSVNLSKVSALYSRQTLNKFIQENNQLQLEDIQFEELISWSVWEQFNEDAVTGWMKDSPSVVQLSKQSRSQVENQTTSLNVILNLSIEKIARENLEDQQKKSSDANSCSTLTFLGQFLKDDEKQKSALDYCATLWFSMAESVAQNRCVLDLCSEYEKSKTNGFQSNNLLPLHELIPNKGDQSIGTLLMFKKNGVKLCPCSKIRFFSDPDMVNLIYEFDAGNDIKNELPPIVLKHSRVWVYYHAGTNALLNKAEQEVQLRDGRHSSLETAVVSIPKEWQIACWLTEKLTNIAIEKENSSNESLEIFKKLILAILGFYEDSKSPNVLKSIVLKLLSRLLIKLRYLCKNRDDSNLNHFAKTYISPDFINGLLSEVMIQMESSNSLHGAFVQDAVEFLMSFVIPIGSQQKSLQSFKDLMQGVKMPDWLTPSLRLSYYLHFFRGDLQNLPDDMIQLQNNNPLFENIIVIPIINMPKQFTIEWLFEQAQAIIVKHQALVLKPETDIIKFKDHLIIVIDGWHPLKPVDQKLSEDSDSEISKEVQAPKINEIPPLVLYNCIACTMENSINLGNCEICQTPRPPLSQLQEAWKQAHMPAEEQKKEEKKIATPLHILRLQDLAQDLRNLVSNVQKKQLLQNRQNSQIKIEEEKKDEPDVDKSDQGEDSEIDLDNLPADIKERFEVLGLDPSFIQQDREFAQVIEMSAIEDIRVRQQRKKAEKAQKQAERQAKLKLKEKLQQKELMDKGGVQLFKFDVKIGKDAFNDPSIAQILQEVLRNRVGEQTTTVFKFNQRTEEVIKQIHSNWQTYQDLKLPENEDLLQDLEITVETLRSVDYETMREMFLNLVLADPSLFFKTIFSQGYDFWLTQCSYPSRPTLQEMDIIRNVPLLEKLKRLIEQDMCQESKLVENLEPHQVRIVTLLGPDFKNSIGYYDESQISNIYPEICESLSQVQMKYMWAMLKNFNQYYAPVIPFINQQEQANQNATDQSILPMSIAAYVSQTRDLCFNCVKTDLRHLILERTTQPRERPPKLYFERLNIADQTGADIQDKTGTKLKQNQEHQFMFNVAHDQIKELDVALLRPLKPLGAEPHIAFDIVFRGEHVVGEGGPYRQFFADISKELQPSRLERGTQQNLLDLLGPCANQRESEKVGRDRFVIQSQANGQKQLSQFEFLGILMGVCIRTGANLILDLPQFFWKQLVGQKITLDDFYEIETKFVKNLQEMLTQSEEDFNKYEHFWTSTLADGHQFEIRSNGSSEKVQYKDIKKFVRQQLEARLRESQAQYNAIKLGISKIIPCSLLNIVTSKELEIWISGKNVLDVDLLMRHTKYSGTYDAEHPVIKLFWTFLSSLREDEKHKFIKFCWGQERIPANDEAFQSQNVRFMIKQRPNEKNQSQDNLLPRADTCFFNFELPMYSTLEVMRQKIITAITLDCVSMNAEDRQVGERDNGQNHGNGEREDQRGLFGDDSY